MVLLGYLCISHTLLGFRAVKTFPVGFKPDVRCCGASWGILNCSYKKFNLTFTQLETPLMTRFKLMLLVVSACVLTLGVQELHAATLTYIVGTCKAGTRFSTIQGALSASPAPDIVQVCPAIYAEQITISNPATPKRRP